MGQRDAFPDGTTLDLLKVMSNETLSTAEKNRLNQIFKTYTDIFFENRALATSTPEVKVSVQDIKRELNKGYRNYFLTKITMLYLKCKDSVMILK